MKNTLKKLKDGALFGIGALLIFGIVNAAVVTLTATTGELLTADKWNTLVAKIDGIFTDGTGNVGIGTETPTAKLDVVGDIRVSQYIKSSNWPAFMVSNDFGGQQSSTGVFPGNLARYNNGGYYDTSTYKFTAPISGIYSFSWTCLTTDTSGRATLDVNGSSYITTESNGKSISATVHLNVGDTVNLTGSATYPIRWYGASNHNGFSGHLVMAD